eukprot:403347165
MASIKKKQQKQEDLFGKQGDPNNKLSDLEREASETINKLDTRAGLVDIYLGNQADEEYNPAQPNDFEKIIGKAKALKKELIARVEREKALKKQIEFQEQQLLGQNQEEEDDFSQMTADEVYQARLKKRQQQSQQPDQYDMGSSEGMGSSNKGDNKVKKMMEAMGWKGKGLGKQEQGIINPLIAKKTDANSAVIVESSITHDLLVEKQAQKQKEDMQMSLRGLPQLPQKQSKVLVFENLVNIQEVDDELRDEVKFECEKYGPLSMCIVHTVPSEELVRIFAQYTKLEDSQNAYIDFSQREFAGKMIKVDFYGEELLKNRQFNMPSLNS